MGPEALLAFCEDLGVDADHTDALRGLVEVAVVRLADHERLGFPVADLVEVVEALQEETLDPLRARRDGLDRIGRAWGRETGT